MLALSACRFSIPAATDATSGGDGADDDAPLCHGATPAWWNAAWATRVHVDTGTAPSGYTLRIPASTVLARALPSFDDVRAVSDDGDEIDRVIEGRTIVVKVPASRSLWLYVENPAAGAPLADPANVFLFAESFDTMQIGSDGSPRFAPVAANTWTVAADGANHVYHALNNMRLNAQISSVLLLEGEIEARMRPGPAGGNNHNGLMVRVTATDLAGFDGFVGQLQEDVDVSRVVEYQNGVSPPVTLAQITRPVDRGTWYDMRVRFAGGVVESYINGTLEVTGANANVDGQMLGLFSHYGDADFDDVRVRAVMSPEPAVALGALESCAP